MIHLKIGFIVLSLISSFSSTYAFWTRGAGRSDDDGDTGSAAAAATADLDDSGEIVNVRPKNAVRRNSIVEEFFASSPGDENVSLKLRDEIRSQAADLLATLVKTRRALHRFPELMYQEEQTSALVKSILTELNINFTSGWAVNTHTNIIPGPGGYGIVADIGTGKEPCVLLRADMDALPILERTEVDFKSTVDQRMHAW